MVSDDKGTCKGSGDTWMLIPQNPVPLSEGKKNGFRPAGVVESKQERNDHDTEDDKSRCVAIMKRSRFQPPRRGWRSERRREKGRSRVCPEGGGGDGTEEAGGRGYRRQVDPVKNSNDSSNIQ